MHSAARIAVLFGVLAAACDTDTQADTTEDVGTDTAPDVDTDPDTDTAGSDVTSAPPGAFQQPHVGAGSGVGVLRFAAHAGWRALRA